MADKDKKRSGGSAAPLAAGGAALAAFYGVPADIAAAAEHARKTNSAEKIYRDTGLFKGADGIWRAERFGANPPSLNLPQNLTGSPQHIGTFRDVLNYPELFAHRPELGDIAVHAAHDPNAPDWGGSYSAPDKTTGWPGRITVNTGFTHDSPLSTLLHEGAGHGMQYYNDWNRGTSPRASGWGAYDKTGGEVEARNIPYREQMFWMLHDRALEGGAPPQSAREYAANWLKNNPPWTTETSALWGKEGQHIPRSEQNVIRYNDPNVYSAYQESRAAPERFYDYRDADHPEHDLWKNAQPAIRDNQTGKVYAAPRGQTHSEVPAYSNNEVPGSWYHDMHNGRYERGFAHGQTNQFVSGNDTGIDAVDLMTPEQHQRWLGGFDQESRAPVPGSLRDQGRYGDEVKDAFPGSKEYKSPRGSIYKMPITDNGKNAGSFEFYVGKNEVAPKYPFIQEASRGKGLGFDAYQKLIDWAHSTGRDFQSDMSVSTSAQKVYDRLRTAGYDVQTNPDAGFPKNGAAWTPNASPVYRIPAPEETQASMRQPGGQYTDVSQLSPADRATYDSLVKAGQSPTGAMRFLNRTRASSPITPIDMGAPTATTGSATQETPQRPQYTDVSQLSPTDRAAYDSMIKAGESPVRALRFLNKVGPQGQASMRQGPPASSIWEAPPETPEQTGVSRPPASASDAIWTAPAAQDAPGAYKPRSVAAVTGAASTAPPGGSYTGPEATAKDVSSQRFLGQFDGVKAPENTPSPHATNLATGLIESLQRPASASAAFNLLAPMVDLAKGTVVQGGPKMYDYLAQRIRDQGQQVPWGIQKNTTSPISQGQGGTPPTMADAYSDMGGATPPAPPAYVDKFDPNAQGNNNVTDTTTNQPQPPSGAAAPPWWPGTTAPGLQGYAPAPSISPTSGQGQPTAQRVQPSQTAPQTPQTPIGGQNPMQPFGGQGQQQGGQGQFGGQGRSQQQGNPISNIVGNLVALPANVFKGVMQGLHAYSQFGGPGGATNTPGQVNQMSSNVAAGQAPWGAGPSNAQMGGPSYWNAGSSVPQDPQSQAAIAPGVNYSGNPQDPYPTPTYPWGSTY